MNCAGNGNPLARLRELSPVRAIAHWLPTATCAHTQTGKIKNGLDKNDLD